MFGFAPDTGLDETRHALNIDVELFVDDGLPPEQEVVHAVADLSVELLHVGDAEDVVEVALHELFVVVLGFLFTEGEVGQWGQRFYWVYLDEEFPD